MNRVYGIGDEAIFSGFRGHRISASLRPAEINYTLKAHESNHEKLITAGKADVVRVENEKIGKFQLGKTGCHPLQRHRNEKNIAYYSKSPD